MTYFMQCQWGLPSQYCRAMQDKSDLNAVDTGGLREDEQPGRVAMADCADLLTRRGRAKEELYT